MRFTYLTVELFPTRDGTISKLIITIPICSFSWGQWRQALVSDAVHLLSREMRQSSLKIQSTRSVLDLSKNVHWIAQSFLA